MTHTNENNMQNTSDYQIKIVDVPVPLTLSTTPNAPTDDTYEYIKRTHNIYFKDKKIGMVYCYLRKDGTIDPLAIMGHMYGWISLKRIHTQLPDGGPTDSLKDGIQKVIKSHLSDLSKTNEQASSRKNKTDFKVRKRTGKHRHTQLQYLYYDVFYKKYSIGIIMPSVGNSMFTYHASANRQGRGTKPQPGEKVPLIQYDWEARNPKTMKVLGYGSEDGLNKAIQHILRAFNTEMSEISNSDDPDWIKRNLSEDEKLNKSDFKVVRKRERVSPNGNFVIVFYIYYKGKLLGHVAYVEKEDGIAIPDPQTNKLFFWLMHRKSIYSPSGWSNSMSECIANIIKNAKKTRKIKENIINDSKNKKSDFNIIKTNFPLDGPYSKSTDFIIFFDIYYKNKKIGRFSYKTLNGTAVPNWFNGKMFTWSASSTWDDHISGHSNSMKECITKIIEIAKKKRKIKENIENNSGFFVKVNRNKVIYNDGTTEYRYQLFKGLDYLGSVVYYVHESDKGAIPVENEYNTPYTWDIGTDLQWDLWDLPTRSKVRGGCNSLKEGFQKILEIYEYVINHPDHLNDPRRRLKDSSTKEGKIKENIENNSGFFVKVSKFQKTKDDLVVHYYRLFKGSYYIGAVTFHEFNTGIPVDNEYNTPYIWYVGTDLHWDGLNIPTFKQDTQDRGGCNSIKEGFQKILEIYEYVINHPKNNEEY